MCQMAKGLRRLASNREYQASQGRCHPNAGGKGGIRTHGTLLRFTAFPMLPIQPLLHLSLTFYYSGRTSFRLSVLPLTIIDDRLDRLLHYNYLGRRPFNVPWLPDNRWGGRHFIVADHPSIYKSCQHSTEYRGHPK